MRVALVAWFAGLGIVACGSQAALTDGATDVGGLGASSSSGGPGDGSSSGASSGGASSSGASSSGASSSGASSSGASSSGASSSGASSSSSGSSSGDAGPTCSETPIPGYTPTWHPPKGFHLGHCTPAQIDEFWTHCLGDAATALTCAHHLSSTDPTCGSCILSKVDDGTYGAVIDYGEGRFDLNYGGCVAAFEDKTDGSGCGGHVQARELCQYEACMKNCPAALDPGDWTYACRMGTFEPGGRCNAHAVAAWCTGDFEGTPGAICQWADDDTFYGIYTRIARAICD